MEKIISIFIVCLICHNANSQWYVQPSGTTDDLYSLHFVTPSTAYAVGEFGTLVKTTNSGVNWFSLTNIISEDLFSVYFTNENTGFAGAWVFNDKPLLLEINGIEERYDIKNPIHIQQPLIQKIVDELLGKDKSPSTGKTGAETNKIIDKILGRLE